jgi:hypothetical protein
MAEQSVAGLRQPVQATFTANDVESIIVEAYSPIAFFATILKDAGELSKRPGARAPEIGEVLHSLESYCYREALDAFGKAAAAQVVAHE